MPKTALEGIRVIDLGRYQAGSRIGLVMARLGAEVIKVETQGGDESRQMGPLVRGQSAYWVQYNSGKKSLGLNLRSAKGKLLTSLLNYSLEDIVSLEAEGAVYRGLPQTQTAMSS